MTEILAPAGNFEKLKTAINFGADAVYAAGKTFGLRAQSSNLSQTELTEAVQFCHSRKKKIYITVNIFAHNSDLKKLPSYLQFLNEIKVDALIISDPGIFLMAEQYAPDIAIHISTQANVTSYKAVEFWQRQGAKRIILARELTFAEILMIREKCPDIELEMFVHGAMCMAYSGRCLLSAFLNRRDANRGNCSQPCRWQYELIEKQRPNQRFSVKEDVKGTYLFNSKDLCLFDQIKKIKAAKIDSVKIEGRMKSAYYTAVITRAYKNAITFTDQPEKIAVFRDELKKVSHRKYTEGFFHRFDATDTQNYEESSYIRNYQYLGKIVKVQKKMILIDILAKFSLGEEIEFVFPDQKKDISFTVKEMWDADGNEIEFTKPNTQIYLKNSWKLSAFGLVRKKIS